MRCITILVGFSNTPRVIMGSRMPRNPISKSGPGFVRWSIQFDRLIKKPRTSSYIRLILLPNGHTVYKVDTLSQYVTIDSNQTALHFEMPNAALSMNGSYAILIDHGAVVGQGCSYDGPPTPGITSLSDWFFNVDGVCPTGYYLAPPDFSGCVDVNECGAHSSFKVNSLDCFKSAVGIANSGIIPDYQMNASSSYSNYYQAAYGRLNETRGGGVWCASTAGGNDEWLQVDLGTSIHACGLAIQGHRGSNVVVLTFKLFYSDDGKSWKTYKNGGNVDVEFRSNAFHGDTIVQHNLPVPVFARYFRFNPTQRNGHNCLRVEIYGTFAHLGFELHVPSGCDQACSNTPGSYICSCVSGYRLDSDGKSCVDINECATNNGGCSHHCFNIPGSFYCGCPEGITMASNNLTCVDASMSVTCTDNNMTVSLEKRTFNFFEVSQLHLRYASCRATENSTHLLISTPLNGCGTLVNETEDALMFWNEVLADAVIIDYVVTRTHDIKVPFYCSYSRKTLLSLSFTPQRIYFGTEAGYGNFTFKMDFYKSSSFSTPYTDQDYPLQVELNDYLYVRFSVESSADLVIMAENCKATKYGSFYSWPQYTIIQNGCPRDTTLDYSYDPTRSYQQFKFKTFRFFNDYDTVYFHCELLACHRYSPNSRCSAGCSANNKRKRREVTRDEVKHDESTTKQVLTGGPLVIKETKESAEPGNPGKSKQAALIGGVAAAGGFGLIAVAALVVLFIKYRIARRFMNRNKVGDLYTTQDEQMGRQNAYIQEDDMIEKDDVL